MASKLGDFQLSEHQIFPVGKMPHLLSNTFHNLVYF